MVGLCAMLSNSLGHPAASVAKSNPGYAPRVSGGGSSIVEQHDLETNGWNAIVAVHTHAYTNTLYTLHDRSLGMVAAGDSRRSGTVAGKPGGQNLSLGCVQGFMKLYIRANRS